MANGQNQQPRSFSEVLKSYFYWTYSRGSFHYDVLVTLILLFIFITPHLWNYADNPPPVSGPEHPIIVSGAGGQNLIVTVRASDVVIPDGATDAQVRKALRKAIDPVMGDAVGVSHWETMTDAEGNLNWRVWAHR
jgi:hypothetical protein